MLQNLPYFWNMKNPHSFFRFSFCATSFFPPNECPGLSRHRPGYSLGGKIKKYCVGFHIPKV